MDKGFVYFIVFFDNFIQCYFYWVCFFGNGEVKWLSFVD